MSELAYRRLLVAGRVQGVGFRAACAQAAGRLGVSGTVRNLSDGRVEVVAAGPRDAVDGLVEWCRRGPRGARVDRVAVSETAGEPSSDRDGFRIVG